ncbi:2136_t:CDS:1 [Funneliformis mosseae]|uniref:2136_t:CDS:1 n=1 Tax=Funneliformis mosseae TaxID=27381 RepID=A0A9N9GDW7_FUNMO|nr:2136_t:CDS:1 [Funneliformis mosseae]
MEIICYHLDPKTKLNFPILPARNSSIDSILINEQHLSILSSWIDDQEDDYVRVPYIFKLLFRATRDGFDAKKFHEICDYKGATLAVISLKNSTDLIGGYNPLGWRPSHTWWKTSKSFLFSLTKDTSKCITGNISRVDPGESDRAILYNRKFGPSFGGAPNLALTNNQVYCYNSNAYPGSESFISVGLTEMANYEVFQIIEIKNH